MIGKSELTGKKVFHTALCLIPPKEIWPEIQDIRSKYDPAYERWMPHINMAFPFLPPNEFETGAQILKEELKKLSPFSIKFREMKYFDHGKNSTLWLNPEVENDELNKLQASIQKAFSFCNDLVKKEGDFTPHLSLGKFDKKDIVKKRDELAATWTAKEFKVTDI